MTANYSSRRSSQSDNSTTNVVTATSSEASSLANENDYSDNSIAAAAKKQQQNNKANKITILSWPNPHTHYISTEEEERLLPILIHWGKTERGMWKDQPSFRLQKVQKALENRGKQSDTKQHQTSWKKAQ